MSFPFSVAPSSRSRPVAPSLDTSFSSRVPVWFGTAQDAPSFIPRPSPGPLASLAGRRILLVEDELLLALDVQMALEGEGAEVIGPIDDLEEGLALLDREPILDAAILDVDLHGEDVFPLAERLRGRNVPFLFHTGHGEREALTKHFDGVPVCIKPVLSERLVDAVEALLA